MYRCNHKCPYCNPVIKLCVSVLYVSADCFINSHLLYLLFVSKLMDKEGTVRVSPK